MDNKISVFIISAIRNLLFAAIAVTPVFFNVTSRRIFEPDKIANLRLLALMAFLFFLIYFIENKKHTIAPYLKYSSLLLISVLLYFLSEVISTIFSIIPQYSIWGSYFRQQGIYTVFAYLIFFFGALYFLSSSFYREFFINVIIATSVPVSIWGISQSAGIDPIPWAVQDISARVTSSLGNPIFLSAYLIMVFPVTLSRVIILFENRNKSKGMHIPNVIIHVLFLILQILAIYMTKSRGPLLGFAASMLFFILCYSKLSGKKFMKYVSTVVLIISIITGLILANAIMRGNGETPSNVGIDGSGNPERILNVAETESGTGKVRLLIWKGAIKLIKSSPLSRILVGYGPESMYVSYNKVYESELSKYESLEAVPDRSHNEPLDILSSKGVIGIIAFIAVYIALFSMAFRRLGILEDKKNETYFWIAGFLIPIILTLLIIWFTVFEELTGVAIGTGIFLTIILFLFRGKSNGENITDNDVTYSNKLYVAGFLSGIIGHLIEGQTGIPIASTNLYFWVYSGSIIAFLSYNNIEEENKNKLSQLSNPLQYKSGNWLSSMIVIILLVTTMFDFLSSDIGLQRSASFYFIFISIIWILTGCIFCFQYQYRDEDKKGTYSKELIKNGTIIFVSSAAVFSICLVLYFMLMKPDASLKHLLAADRIADYIGFYIVTIIVIILATSVAEVANISGSNRLAASPFRMVVYLLAGIICGIFAYRINIFPIKADCYFNVGSTLKSSKGQDLSMPFFEKAVLYNPSEEVYRKALGVALMGNGVRDSKNRQMWFDKAENEVEAACKLNPENAHNFYVMGLMYKQWATVEASPAKRKPLLEKAAKAFETSISLTPGRGYIYREAGENYMILGELTKAKDYFQISANLNNRDENSCILLGDILRKLGKLDEALKAYNEAVKRKPDSIRAYSSIAYIYTMKNDSLHAIDGNLKVLGINPNDYDAHKNLAILYDRITRYDDALNEAEKAFAVAPKNQKERMGKYIEELKVRMKRS